MEQKQILSAHTRTELKKLREYLQFTGFIHLLAAYGSEADRWRTLRFDLSLLPKKLCYLTKLFCLGDKIDVTTVISILSSKIVDMLKDLNIFQLSENGQLSLGKLRLVYHYGVLIFCERPTVFSQFYYGDDSLALGRLLQFTQGHVLDICAGVGTQGLLCALTAEKVISVEIQQAVAPLFAINAALNGLENKIELRIGNFLTPIHRERFNHVCCNPPLLPIPNDIAYPLVGDGGVDGLTITKKLLTFLPELLVENGYCHIVGVLLGTIKEPDLSTFQTIAQDIGLNIQMVFMQQLKLAYGTPMLEGLVTTASAYGNAEPTIVREAFIQYLSESGANYLYSFLMGASVIHTKNEKGTLEITRHYERNASFWTV